MFAFLLPFAPPSADLIELWEMPRGKEAGIHTSGNWRPASEAKLQRDCGIAGQTRVSDTDPGSLTQPGPHLPSQLKRAPKTG